MIFKLLIALLVAYAGWRVWKHGFGRSNPRRMPGRQPSGPPGLQPGPQPSRETRVEEPLDAAAARRLLGVDRAADAATIRAAHRRLMAEAHPDRGGSAEEARALNAARDILLGRAG